MSRPECKKCPLDNTTCTFPACPHLEMTRKMKYPACQECSRADDGQCDTCAPSDRIMKTIRQEVQDSLAAAKLAGYRQAQREEFHHLCGLIGGPEPHDQIIERIRHLRKELGL